MKKAIVGFIAGAIFMLSTQAYGSGISLIGKKVSGEVNVVVDGKQLSKAIIVEGKSYAPVRDISNGVGADLIYEKGGPIVLSTNSSSSEKSVVDIIEKRDLETKISQQENKLKEIKKTISDLELQITDVKAKITKIEEQGYEAMTQNIELSAKTKALDEYNDKLVQETKILDDLKAQLVDLQK